jgi:tetratricopeptide (TPR) repeat protein
MDVHEAAEVSGVTGADDSSQVLDALVEKSLVRWVAARRVFRLHPLVRQYAQEKLLPPPREMVRQRHAFYFLEYLVERTTALFGPGTRTAIDEIYDALADILVAWDWCVQARETEKLAQAGDTLAAFYEYAGLAGEGFALFERTVQALEGSADVSRGLILRLELARARLLLRLGKHAEAHTLAERVLQEAEQSNHRELMAWSRYVRALALARLPDTEQELAELERARDEAQSTNQTRLEALCLVREGMVAMRAGEYRAAKNHTLQASEIFERVLDVRYTGGCFAMLGLIEFTLGEMQEAILVQTRAIEIADRIRDEYLKAVTLHNLGNTLASQGQYENALASMKQSEQIYRTVGTTALVIGSQAQAGLFLALLGRWVEARGTLEHVTRVAAAEGMSRELGWANVGLAVLARRQGQLQDAVRFGRLALEPAMRWNDAHDRADAAIVLADTLIEQGALDEAEENYRAALALREQMQQTHLYPEAFVGLAHAAMQRGETETARAWMEKAWNGESLRLLPGPKEPFWIYWTGYQVMRALGDPRAERLVETAQMVFAEYVSQISDLETRDQYLLVPWHRAILKATHASPSLPFFVFSDAAALRAQ